MPCRCGGGLGAGVTVVAIFDGMRETAADTVGGGIAAAVLVATGTDIYI